MSETLIKQAKRIVWSSMAVEASWKYGDLAEAVNGLIFDAGKLREELIKLGAWTAEDDKFAGEEDEDGPDSDLDQ